MRAQHDSRPSGGDDAGQPFDAVHNPDHFAYARAHDLIVVTKNPDDFEELHRRYPEHPGIFAIYQDNDPRDMSYPEIAQAIANIVAAEIAITGAFHILNRRRY